MLGTKLGRVACVCRPHPSFHLLQTSLAVRSLLRTIYIIAPTTINIHNHFWIQYFMYYGGETVDSVWGNHITLLVVVRRYLACSEYTGTPYVGTSTLGRSPLNRPWEDPAYRPKACLFVNQPWCAPHLHSKRATNLEHHQGAKYQKALILGWQLNFFAYFSFRVKHTMYVHMKRTKI